MSIQKRIALFTITIHLCSQPLSFPLAISVSAPSQQSRFLKFSLFLLSPPSCKVPKNLNNNNHIGSYLVKKLKLGAAGALKVVCVAMFTALVLDSLFVFGNCENPEIFGLTKEFGNRYV